MRVNETRRAPEIGLPQSGRARRSAWTAGVLKHALVLLTLIGGLYWLGWRSRWARASTVPVIAAVDAPKPVAPPPQAASTPAPDASSATAAQAASPADDEEAHKNDGRGAETRAHRRGARRTTQPSDADAAGDGWSPAD